MKNIGKKYRELRKEQGITLAQAANGICASSNLSRWENGNVNLEFNKVLALINQIHITPDEFIGHAQIEEKDNIPQEIYDAIEREDTNKIKELALSYLDRYHEKRITHQLFLAVILCNQYLLLKNKNLLPYHDQVRLYNYLSKINLWSTYNLTLFGNSVFMMKSNKVYAIATHILNNLSLINENTNDQSTIILMGILGDATLSLIFRKDLEHAEKLLAALDQIELPMYLSFFKLTINFIKKVVKYMNTGDENYVLSFIQNTLDLGMNSAANTFLDVFKRAKEIE